MTDPVFQQAYEAVRQSCSAEEWAALTPRELSDAIYREIRRIDARAAGTGEAKPVRVTKPRRET